MTASKKSRLARVALVGAFGALSIGLVAAPASASTFTVTNASASGAGSLNKAIDDADAHAGADTIVFAPATNGLTIAAPTSAIEAGGALTITGNGAGVTKIDGELDINSDTGETTTATISGLTVGDFNINSGHGGVTNATITNANIVSNGIDMNSGFNNSKTNVTLTNVHVTGNLGITANEEASQTTATITNSSVDAVDDFPLDVVSSNVNVFASTFSNSTDPVTNDDGTLHMTNVTITNNGGGSEGQGISSSGHTTLQNVTITKNGAQAIRVESGTADITNTILAGNSGNECSVLAGATLTSHGGNLSDDATCHAIASDKKNTQPKLGPLANNGGPTKTQLLLSGSPAIDGGVATGCPKTDQRGIARPQDGNHDGIAECDIGAVELAGPAVVTTTTVKVAGSTVPATAATTLAPTTVAAAAQLPRTGSSSSAPLAFGGACLVAVGLALAGSSRRRRAVR
jgi:LPXTG-motif cell wall-anchored protein